MTSPDPATPPALRPTGTTLLVRTDFDDQRSWEALCAGIRTPTEEGFLAMVDIVDDQAYRDLAPARLRDLLPDRYDGPHFFFVVDHIAVASAGYPILVVPVDYSEPEYAHLNEPERVEFRVVVAELWSVENNLSLANMDWESFAHNADDDGVYRGTRGPL